MPSPYETLPPRQFWRTGVAQQDPRAIEQLYRKKFAIRRTTKIATAGSCFAQHIARHLKSRGFTVVDTEPPPPGLEGEAANRFGYLLYSARYGNIYVPRQLLQLVQEAEGSFTPENWIWTRDGRFYDALRPSVEPSGLASEKEVRLHRSAHLVRVREAIAAAEVFVFTFGLTEAWVHRSSGTVYPTAPGTICGSFDPDEFAFHNFTFSEIVLDFRKFRRLAKQLNPKLRFILTVSPVPLTATASEHHVLVATTHSKSVLRAAAGELSATFADVDYFPSYEIITGPCARGAFYEPNLRSVTAEGVEAAMRAFFSEHDPDGRKASPVARGPAAQAKAPRPSEDEDVICEEALLESFAQ